MEKREFKTIVELRNYYMGYKDSLDNLQSDESKKISNVVGGFITALESLQESRKQKATPLTKLKTKRGWKKGKPRKVKVEAKKEEPKVEVSVT